MENYVGSVTLKSGERKGMKEHSQRSADVQLGERRDLMRARWSSLSLTVAIVFQLGPFKQCQGF